MTEDNILQQFAEELAKDSKLVERLKRSQELAEFKEKYNVERASPLKCPACSGWQMSGGSLWMDKDDPNRFVCRKCHIEWKVECLTYSNEELIIKIREANK